MVRIGFIVEGDSEKIVIESVKFREFLTLNGFELVTPVVNAKGGGNLLPQNIEAYLHALQHKNIEQIVVLTDLEGEASIADVRTRIAHADISVIFVAVKALEAWFLSDTDALRSWLGDAHYIELQPEQTAEMPWDRLKEIAAQLGKRGPGNKVGFAKKMVKNGFCITRAAQHGSCASARDLVDWFENQ